MKTIHKILALTSVLFINQAVVAQKKNKVLNKALAAQEAEYYKIVDVPIPKDITLEVGGLALTDDNKLGVSTRRGEVWVIDKPNSEQPTYSLFASGMHEVLGLAYRNNSFFASQRGELTELIDDNKDGKVDYYKTFFSWPLSGNYHEYSYGPRVDKDGNMFVHLNVTWANGGQSFSKWRGWLLKFNNKGEMIPFSTGFRSPAGLGIMPNGDIFYSENQGDWVGSGRITHLEKGDFAGHPESLRWTDEPNSPLKLKPSDIKSDYLSMYEYGKELKELKAPALWLPHTILGTSTSDIIFDTTEGDFGPFKGQMFVGDQGNSRIVRVSLEKVNGVYQGAAFGFVEGFSSGVLRMIWSNDNSMFVGMTSRGWGSIGRKQFGLQRLVWTGKTPFEVKTMKALNDGFELEFTKPVDKKMAKDIMNYKVASFTYKYHQTYGSPIEELKSAMVHHAEVSKDGLKVKLTIHGMRLGYIHQIEMPNLESKSGELLLHNKGFYTLNEVPGGKLKSAHMAMADTPKKVIDQPKRATKMPASWGKKGADEKIELGTIPGLQYNLKKITIKSGSKIQLTLTNNDDMLHNMVIMKPGADTPVTVGNMALQLGLEGPELSYVPDTDLVLFHSGIVGPESTETIYFTAPTKPGQYWIVCTFPGHAYTMQTQLIVK
ncbi:azurin/glucose/arabinose dehydrogenase [Wenyingzhuangia heitensis]|uniref:Azurin/glucose/arabinose dehydrogenase n=1 Tax=Wenyingzhuangia heitensis TaxID=1487859 RepID=A0ABX0UAT8_9FLAO|nr:sulfocyanin-like copper-binding protein [Wenyingzhuangia heitensis]NIJ45942.1 azurin/glucose/arabinose dehydrogenase [Wenyingzhuangia heitensis]